MRSSKEKACLGLIDLSGCEKKQVLNLTTWPICDLKRWDILSIQSVLYLG